MVRCTSGRLGAVLSCRQAGTPAGGGGGGMFMDKMRVSEALRQSGEEGQIVGGPRNSESGAAIQLEIGRKAEGQSGVERRHVRTVARLGRDFEVAAQFTREIVADREG